MRVSSRVFSSLSNISPPKPEAQLPDWVPPPSVHSVEVVHTPVFTLTSVVVHSSFGNWTMLNRDKSPDNEKE